MGRNLVHCSPLMRLPHLSVILLAGISRCLKGCICLLCPQLVVRGHGEILRGGQAIHLVFLRLRQLLGHFLVVAARQKERGKVRGKVMDHYILT